MSSNIRKIVGILIFVAALSATAGARADEPAPAPENLKAGLSPTAQLLNLMDTDKSGKVSKEEFMRFMAAEFDLADTNKNGELDPKELQHWLHGISHPSNGPGR